jgi:hypothetical protein
MRDLVGVDVRRRRFEFRRVCRRLMGICRGPWNTISPGAAVSNRPQPGGRSGCEPECRPVRARRGDSDRRNPARCPPRLQWPRINARCFDGRGSLVPSTSRADILYPKAEDRHEANSLLSGLTCDIRQECSRSATPLVRRWVSASFCLTVSLDHAQCENTTERTQHAA